jgi:hypothetical protein
VLLQVEDEMSRLHKKQLDLEEERNMFEEGNDLVLEELVASLRGLHAASVAEATRAQAYRCAHGHLLHTFCAAAGAARGACTQTAPATLRGRARALTACCSEHRVAVAAAAGASSARSETLSLWCRRQCAELLRVVETLATSQISRQQQAQGDVEAAAAEALAAAQGLCAVQLLRLKECAATVSEAAITLATIEQQQM